MFRPSSQKTLGRRNGLEFGVPPGRLVGDLHVFNHRLGSNQDDGCHKGSKCEFCHLCGPTEALRRSKKVHTARKKQEEAVLRREAHTGADRSQTGAVVRTRPATCGRWRVGRKG